MSLKWPRTVCRPSKRPKRLLPDVILLDVMMPGMNGLEVCKRIRNDPQIAEIPIIMLTALDDRDSLLNALKAGADDFISKPFDRYELRARLMGITQPQPLSKTDPGTCQTSGSKRASPGRL